MRVCNVINIIKVMKVHEGCIKHVFINLNVRVKEEEMHIQERVFFPFPLHSLSLGVLCNSSFFH